jgi:hypothetical protein
MTHARIAFPPARAAAVAATLLFAAGCAGTSDDMPPPEPLTKTASGTPVNWPAPPLEIERRLASESFEVRKVEPAAGGTTGALKLELFFPAHGDSLSFKWKTVPQSDADGWNNAPRKELAAYALQAWFLDPPDYLVPTTAVRCLALSDLQSKGVAAKPSLAGTSCVLGVLSVWMEDVTVPQHVYDATRFSSDPLYATYVARFNLLTYLIEHRDGRSGNFLISKEADDPRLFAVDNGISFDAVIQNWFVANWDTLRVPALPKDAIERLRQIDRSRIDQLGVLLEMQQDAQGMLKVVPPQPNRDPRHGARVYGGGIQFGLTRSEIDHVEERLRALLARVDRGELPLF